MVTFDAGTTGIAGTVGVAIFNADGSVFAARSTAGVSEIGTGVYAIADPDPSKTLTFVWDTGVGTSCWSETLYAGRDKLPNLDASVSMTAKPSDVQVTVNPTPVTVDIDESTVAAAVYADLMENLSVGESLVIGPGIGSIRHEDVLTGTNNRPIKNAIVRAYPYNPETRVITWSQCKGENTTNSSGSYHLNLDPGTYARRVWKSNVVVLDDLLTIS